MAHEQSRQNSTLLLGAETELGEGVLSNMIDQTHPNRNGNKTPNNNQKAADTTISKSPSYLKKGYNKTKKYLYKPKNIIQILTLVFVAGYTVTTYYLFLNTRAYNRDQLTLTFPPKLIVNSIHIWEKGKGSPQNPKNVAPQFIPGTKIDGAVMAANSGREVATIVGSDCGAFWLDHLRMTNPQWGNRHPNEIGLIEPGKPPYDLIPSIDGQNEMKPGDIERWGFETTVPNDVIGKELYVIGWVVYNDRLKTRRGVFFARKYDPSREVFSPVYDPNYETNE
jgi:hypothetical protein